MCELGTLAGLLSVFIYGLSAVNFISSSADLQLQPAKLMV